MDVFDFRPLREIRSDVSDDLASAIDADMLIDEEDFHDLCFPKRL